MQIMQYLPEHLHGIVSLGFFTGMREGEILGLTWDKVNMQHEFPHIKLSKDDTKEGKEKIVPLAGKIDKNPLAILRATPKALHTNRVFLNGGRLVDKKHLHRYMKKACTAAGIIYGRFEIGGLIFHDLRHCFATYAGLAGVDQLTIMAIMGHSPGRGLEMQYRYRSFRLADLWQAVIKMESYLMQSNIEINRKENNN